MKKLLIIDDEDDIRDMLAVQFKEKNFDVHTASDGQEGLAKAKDVVPDLIIVDEMMPKMDGYKLSGLLKSDKRFSTIPVIMFTARAEQPNENLSKEAGIDVYMTKLADFEELYNTALKLLKEKAEE